MLLKVFLKSCNDDIPRMHAAINGLNPYAPNEFLRDPRLQRAVLLLWYCRHYVIEACHTGSVAHLTPSSQYEML
jgi:hypothetical protein